MIEHIYQDAFDISSTTFVTDVVRMMNAEQFRENPVMVKPSDADTRFLGHGLALMFLIIALAVLRTDGRNG